MGMLTAGSCNVNLIAGTLEERIEPKNIHLSGYNPLARKTFPIKSKELLLFKESAFIDEFPEEAALKNGGITSKCYDLTTYHFSIKI